MTNFVPNFNWDWANQANCKDEDPDLFFELERQKVLANAIKKHFCVPCPVRKQCLETSAMIPERYGIWGGLNYSERNAYAKLRTQGRTHWEALRIIDCKWIEEGPQLCWEEVEGYARDKAKQLREADES